MDDWDPTPAPHEFRIYGDDNGSIFAAVDEEDWHHLIQWLWSPKWSRGGRKVYLRRNSQVGKGRTERTRKTIFLHQAVMERKGDIPPSPLHTIIDHRNSDGLDCRRQNLRWATHSMNSLNRDGRMPYDLEEIANGLCGTTENWLSQQGRIADVPRLVGTCLG